jgi:DNA-3-methyladenine glycosylase I
MEINQNLFRCPWSGASSTMTIYHDTEWGVPLHDDLKLFEFLVLDAFQAGLSWQIVLHKRDAMRTAFKNFNPEILADFNDHDFYRLLSDDGIIRNKQKINATIVNAKQYINIEKEYGTFDKFIWQFTNYKTIVNHWDDQNQIPTKSAASEAMSKELTKRGFKFVGPTICYAFMQAIGMVNDHLVSCFRYNELLNNH